MSFVIVQSWSHVELSAALWTAAHQVPLSSTMSWSLVKLMSIESVMLSNHPILCCPLLLLPSIFPSIMVFSSESAIYIRWTSKVLEVNFSINSSNEFSGLVSYTDWFDLAVQVTQESSPAPQFKSINSLPLSLLYGPALSSVHDYCKSHNFDYTDLCLQNDVSAF